jgi:hypothetical protein
VQRIHNFVDILGEECVIATGYFGKGKRTETVENVLNETLKCAVEVHQFIIPKTEKKLAIEKKWLELDEHFEKVLQAIWVLYEPGQQFYAECHKLVTSKMFKEMVETLRHKFPITKGEKDNGIDAQGKMDYAKLLSAMSEDFDGNFKTKKSAVKHGYIIITDKYKKDQMVI